MLIKKSKVSTEKFDSAIEIKLNNNTGSSHLIRGVFSSAKRRLSALFMSDKEPEQAVKLSTNPLSMPTCINE